jgi:hypothetical protein
MACCLSFVITEAGGGSSPYEVAEMNAARDKVKMGSVRFFMRGDVQATGCEAKRVARPLANDQVTELGP